MKVNELRIGNWFYRHCCNDQVMEVRAGGVLGLDNLRGIISLHEMQPIELTKEFFTKNGFIEQVGCDEYGTYFRSSVLRTEVFETSGGWSVHIDDDHFMSVFGKCIKYVHEFQNAYYISTGEELEIEL